MSLNKTLKKYFSKIFLMVMIILGFNYGTMAAQADPNVIVAEVSANTRADVFIWKFKAENGKKYKRLYNQTTNKWIGNWILLN